MLIPTNPDSPTGENKPLDLLDEAVIPQFNPATSSPLSFMDEDEWLAMFTMVDVEYNPATQDLLRNDE